MCCGVYELHPTNPPATPLISWYMEQKPSCLPTSFTMHQELPPTTRMMLKNLAAWMWTFSRRSAFLRAKDPPSTSRSYAATIVAAYGIARLKRGSWCSDLSIRSHTNYPHHGKDRSS